MRARLPHLESVLPELEAAHAELEAARAELEAEQHELEAALAAGVSELELRTAEGGRRPASRGRSPAPALAGAHEHLWRLTKPLRALGRGAASTSCRGARRQRLSPGGCGDTTRREGASSIRFGAAPAGARPRVVFLSGEPDTPGHRYRVTNVASTLAPRFFDTRVLRLDELERRADELEGAAVLWIWRAPYLPEVASAIEKARRGAPSSFSTLTTSCSSTRSRPRGCHRRNQDAGLLRARRPAPLRVHAADAARV